MSAKNPSGKTDADLLRDTFEIAVSDERFGARFYARLFQAHPELRKMFSRNSSGAQQKMFAQKLAAIVDAVVEPKILHDEAVKVAQSHVGYGVKPEMYDWVGVILLETLRESVGSEWTPEAERAWQGAYSAIKTMILSSPG
ncbi:MAG: globin domain-containing protein [Labilithrix sp.]